MPEKPPSDNGDERLDALLAGKPVQPGHSFADRVLNAAQQPDARLDALLESQPVRPREGFAKRTLERCRKAQPVVSFPARGLWAPLAAAAAVAVVAWTALQLEQPEPSTSSAPAAVAMSPGEFSPAPAAEQSDFTRLSDNPDVEELFSLATGLSKADPLLDKNSMDTLAMLSSWK